MKVNNLILISLLGLFFLASNGKIVRRNMNVEEFNDIGKNLNLDKGRIMPPGLDLDIDNLEAIIKENEENEKNKEKKEREEKK